MEVCRCVFQEKGDAVACVNAAELEVFCCSEFRQCTTVLHQVLYV